MIVDCYPVCVSVSLPVFSSHTQKRYLKFASGNCYLRTRSIIVAEIIDRFVVSLHTLKKFAANGARTARLSAQHGGESAKRQIRRWHARLAL